MGKREEYTCPYCRKRTVAEINSGIRSVATCEHCGLSTVFDYNGLGSFGHWHPDACEQCRSMRIHNDIVLTGDWHCVKGGCNAVRVGDRS